MKYLRFFSLLLIIVGAINWGLWGFFQYDLVADFLGSNTAILARLVYCLVGLAGLFGIRFFFIKANYGCGKFPCCKDDKEGQ